MDGVLTCSRQRFLFDGISREHQTLENLTQLQKKECRVFELSHELERAKQDLWDFRQSLGETVQERQNSDSVLGNITEDQLASELSTISIWEDSSTKENLDPGLPVDTRVLSELLMAHSAPELSSKSSKKHRKPTNPTHRLVVQDSILSTQRHTSERISSHASSPVINFGLPAHDCKGDVEEEAEMEDTTRTESTPGAATDSISSDNAHQVIQSVSSGDRASIDVSEDARSVDSSLTETSPTKRLGVQGSVLTPCVAPRPKPAKRKRPKTNSRARLAPLKKDNSVLRLSPKTSSKKSSPIKQYDWVPKSSPLRDAAMTRPDSSDDAPIELTAPDKLPQQLFMHTDVGAQDSCLLLELIQSDMCISPITSEKVNEVRAETTIPNFRTPHNSSPEYNPVSPYGTPMQTSKNPFTDENSPEYKITTNVSPVMYMTTPSNLEHSANAAASPGRASHKEAYERELEQFKADKREARVRAAELGCTTVPQNGPFDVDYLPVTFSAGDDVFSDPFLQSVSEVNTQPQSSHQCTFDIVNRYCDPFSDPPLSGEPYDPELLDNYGSPLMESPAKSTYASAGLASYFMNEPLEDDAHLTTTATRKVSSDSQCSVGSKNLLLDLIEEVVKTSPTSHKKSFSFPAQGQENIDSPPDEQTKQCGAAHIEADDSSPKRHSRKASLHEGLDRVKNFFTIRSNKKRARAKSSVGDFKFPLPSGTISQDDDRQSRPAKRISYLPKLVKKASRQPPSHEYQGLP